MKSFIEKHPFWFVLIFTVAINAIGFVVVAGGRVIGLPQIPIIFAVAILTTAIPLGFIHSLGWWRDAGFVATTHNWYALAIPIFNMIFALIFYGTVDKAPQLASLHLAASFLTGLSEEALSRGLFVRALLPHGKWQAVLLPAVLFGAQHIFQSLGNGMASQDNLIQIADALVVGILYGAVRLRINNIWPLIITHTLNNTFFSLAGFAPPNPVHNLADIPILLYLIRWLPSLVVTVYIMRKPLAATINGKPVGIWNRPSKGVIDADVQPVSYER